MKRRAGIYSGGLSALLSQRALSDFSGSSASALSVLAPATSECQQIGDGTSGLDADHHHASLAVAAAWPLNRSKQRIKE
jgi:hypothetical protein